MDPAKVVWAPDTGLPVPNSHKASEKASASSSKQQPQPSLWSRDKELVDGLFVPPLNLNLRKKMAKKARKDTAGDKWFDMPAPTLTPELKREVQLVKMRKILDPKRHYKASDSKQIPKYFQIGTVVSGPADFYSSRLTKKERKMSFADELLNDPAVMAYTKRKYGEIQKKKQEGGKGFWKKRVEKRKPSWAKS